jgi:SAM-dependent methyltransferase
LITGPEAANASLLPTAIKAVNPDESTFPVSPLITPDDQMYAGNKEHYFNCGQSALLFIKRILTEYDVAEPQYILDFACGYGRVLRFLRTGFPDSHISVFDTNKKAGIFCVESLKANERISSHKHLQKIAVANPPDLIWCGSLFTHINANKALKILKLFQNILKPGGILIFTTHGDFSFRQMQSGKITYGLKDSACRKILADFQKKDYGFQPYRIFGVYGIAIAPPKWYQKLLTPENGWSQSGFTPQTWDNHQDIHYARKND